MFGSIKLIFIHIPSLSGWLDNELKISNSFLDDDVDDLGLHLLLLLSNHHQV